MYAFYVFVSCVDDVNVGGVIAVVVAMTMTMILVVAQLVIVAIFFLKRKYREQVCFMVMFSKPSERL